LTGLDSSTARRLLLVVAAVYLLFNGVIELSKATGDIDAFIAAELVRKATTLASLAVGLVIGFYLASRQRQS
jgi:hypothetical protein